MRHFNDERFQFCGREIVVPSSRVLRLLSVIELNMDVIKISTAQIVPVSTMALQYSKVLNFIGFDVSEEELFEFYYSDRDAVTNDIAKIFKLLNYLSHPNADQNKINSDSDQMDDGDEQKK